MSIPSSHRPAREWFLLILALLIVGGIAVPAWQATGTGETRAEFISKWGPERLAKLFLGPAACHCHTTPWSIMASTTFRNPAMLAPTT